MMMGESAAVWVQLEWQRRANTVLGYLLDIAAAGDPLPAGEWTVEAVGCRVTGRFPDPDPSGREAALRAWAATLNAVVSERRSRSGKVHLSAAARLPEDDEVRIQLSANVWKETDGD